VTNELLGQKAGYSKGGEGGMSRTNQYLRYIVQNMEELRMIREYRWGLRGWQPAWRVG
jgi:hypothetical protein